MGKSTHGSVEVIPFKNDEVGFREWMNDPDNATGFVLNSYRNPDREYLILHRATCGTLLRPMSDGKAMTGEFIKHCASTEEALQDWALREVGGRAQLCGVCYRLAGIGKTVSN